MLLKDSQSSIKNILEFFWLRCRKKKIWRAKLRCVTWKVELKKKSFNKSERSNYKKYMIEIANQAITAACNREDALIMLTTAASGKSWICKLLPFVVSRDTSPTGNRISDLEFYWGVTQEFYSWLEIWNCEWNWWAGKFVKKPILLRQNKSSLE